MGFDNTTNSNNKIKVKVLNNRVVPRFISTGVTVQVHNLQMGERLQELGVRNPEFLKPFSYWYYYY